MNLISVFLMMGGEAAKDGKPQNSLMSLLPFLLIIVVIYFFMIRPQSKKAKQAKQFKEQIKKGDKVVTIGGIHGRIIEIRDNDLLIEIADGVRVTIIKDAISVESTQFVNTAKAPEAK